jgi:hypothetical protein
MFIWCICPVCGKGFPKYPEHSLTNGKGAAVCSCHCSTAAYQKSEEKKRQKELRRLDRERKKQSGKAGYNCKAVELCDRDGNVVRQFPSISVAEKETGYSASTISRVCAGKFDITGKYTFRFENPALRPLPNKIVKRDRSYQFRPVLQFNMDGVYLARHESIRAAAREIGCKPSTVSNQIAGRLKHIKSFVFIYEDKFMDCEKGG